MPFKPVGGVGNIDFANAIESLNALQRNPQASRVTGPGSVSFTGSLIYAVSLDSGSLLVSDSAGSWGVAAPGLSIPAGIPSPGYGPAGALITITPSNLSTVHWTC